MLDATVASLVAGVTVTFAASTAIYGLATFAERRREGREAAAVGAAVIAAGRRLLVFAGAIGTGLYVMINGELTAPISHDSSDEDRSVTSRSSSSWRWR